MEDMERTAHQASGWVSALESDGTRYGSELTAWLFLSATHIAEYLEMLEVERALHFVDPDRKLPVSTPVND